MRFWLLTVCLLILLPAAAEGKGMAAGVKSDALLSTLDNDTFLNIAKADAEAEPESGDGILLPLSMLTADPIPPVYPHLRTILAEKRYASFEIRGPPVIS